MPWYYFAFDIIVVFLAAIYMDYDKKFIAAITFLVLSIWMWLLTCDVVGVT